MASAERAGTPIADFPAASTPTNSDVLAGVQSGVTKKFGLPLLLAWIKSKITPSDIGAVPTSRTVNGKPLTGNITLNADDVGVQVTQVGTIELGSTWSGSGPYTQVVSVVGVVVTENSKIDLQPTPAQLVQWLTDNLQGMLVENNAGVVTVYAIGAAPSAAATVQCTVEEVEQ